MFEVRPAQPEELVGLPEVERLADTRFDSLGIGPFPPPGTVEALCQAMVILVTGHPPIGFARIDRLLDGAHLEQLSVHPDHGGHGAGRALLQAACLWIADAGYDALTLATYRDIPWNGPFYASEGFTEVGPADEWYAERGLPPEESILGQFGARVIMRRTC